MNNVTRACLLMIALALAGCADPASTRNAKPPQSAKEVVSLLTERLKPALEVTTGVPPLSEDQALFEAMFEAGETKCDELLTIWASATSEGWSTGDPLLPTATGPPWALVCAGSGAMEWFSIYNEADRGFLGNSGTLYCVTLDDPSRRISLFGVDWPDETFVSFKLTMGEDSACQDSTDLISSAPRETYDDLDRSEQHTIDAAEELASSFVTHITLNEGPSVTFDGRCISWVTTYEAPCEYDLETEDGRMWLCTYYIDSGASCTRRL